MFYCYFMFIIIFGLIITNFYYYYYYYYIIIINCNIYFVTVRYVMCRAPNTIQHMGQNIQQKSCLLLKFEIFPMKTEICLEQIYKYCYEELQLHCRFFI